MYTGPERRKMNQDDHDLLTRIDSNLIHVKEWCQKHDTEDNARFSKVDREIEFGKKVFWGGIGILAAIQFLFQFIK